RPSVSEAASPGQVRAAARPAVAVTATAAAARPSTGGVSRPLLPDRQVLETHLALAPGVQLKRDDAFRKSRRRVAVIERQHTIDERHDVIAIDRKPHVVPLAHLRSEER